MRRYKRGDYLTSFHIVLVYLRALKDRGGYARSRHLKSFEICLI